MHLGCGLRESLPCRPDSAVTPLQFIPVVTTAGCQAESWKINSGQAEPKGWQVPLLIPPPATAMSFNQVAAGKPRPTPSTPPTHTPPPPLPPTPATFLVGWGLGGKFIRKEIRLRMWVCPSFRVPTRPCETMTLVTTRGVGSGKEDA